MSGIHILCKQNRNARWHTYRLKFLCLFVCGKSHVFRLIKQTFKKSTEKDRNQSVTGTYWPWLLLASTLAAFLKGILQVTHTRSEVVTVHIHNMKASADKGIAASFITSSKPLSHLPTQSPPNILIIIYSSNHNRNYFTTSGTFPHRTRGSNSSVVLLSVLLLS